MWCEACSGSSVVCTALLIIGTVVATASCTGDELVVLPSATDAGTDVGTVVDAVADASVVDARPIPKLCILPSGYQAPFDPTEWYDARDARITTAESVAKWSPLGPSKAILNAINTQPLAAAGAVGGCRGLVFGGSGEMATAQATDATAWHVPSDTQPISLVVLVRLEVPDVQAAYQTVLVSRIGSTGNTPETARFFGMQIVTHHLKGHAGVEINAQLLGTNTNLEPVAVSANLVGDGEASAGDHVFVFTASASTVSLRLDRQPAVNVSMTAAQAIEPNTFERQVNNSAPLRVGSNGLGTVFRGNVGIFGIYVRTQAQGPLGAPNEKALVDQLMTEWGVP